MSHVREFVIRFETSAQLDENTLRKLPFEDLLDYYPKALHIISDVVVNLAEMEAELHAEAPSDSTLIMEKI